MPINKKTWIESTFSKKYERQVIKATYTLPIFFLIIMVSTGIVVGLVQEHIFIPFMLSLTIGSIFSTALYLVSKNGNNNIIEKAQINNSGIHYVSINGTTRYIPWSEIHNIEQYQSCPEYYIHCQVTTKQFLGVNLGRWYIVSMGENVGRLIKFELHRRKSSL